RGKCKPARAALLAVPGQNPPPPSQTKEVASPAPCSETHHPPRHYELSIRVHNRNPMACCESSNLLSPGDEKSITLDKQRPGSCLGRTFEGSVNFAIGARFQYLNL